MRCPRRWLGLTFLALVSAASASAQEDSPDARLAEATRELAAGAPVRISTQAGATYYGSYVGWLEPALLYQSDRETARVLAPDIAELRTDRRAWRKGATVGAISGTVLGVLFGIVVNDVCDNGQVEAGCGDRGLRYATVYGVLLGGAGGAVGGAIGSAFHEWHPVYSSLDAGR